MFFRQRLGLALGLASLLGVAAPARAHDTVQTRPVAPPPPVPNEVEVVPADFRVEDYFREDAPETYAAPENMVEADLAARELIKKFEDDVVHACSETGCTRESFLRDNVIVITHEGEHWGRELSWIIGHLKRAGYKLKVFRRKPEKSADAISELERKEMELSRNLWLRFEHEAKDDPELKKLVERGELNEGVIRSSYRSLSTFLRSATGLHNGISWGWYSDAQTGVRRPLRWQLFELALGLPRAFVVGAVTWAGSVGAKGLAAKYAAFNTVSGVVAATSLQVIWSYIDRANKLRHAQGKNFREDQKSIDTNRLTFGISCYLDSLLINFIVIGFQHGGLFGIPSERVELAFWNSFVGLFAKLLPELLIAKRMQGNTIKDSRSAQHSVFSTIFWSTSLAMVMGALKYGHLMEWHWGFRTVYEGLMYSYFGYELWNHFFVNKDPNVWGGTGYKALDYGLVFFKTLRKDFRRVLEWVGLRKPKMCETLLSIRPVTPEELSDPRHNGIL